jgi:hypothetical protein
VGGKKVREKIWGRWWLALIPDVNSQMINSPNLAQCKDSGSYLIQDEQNE